MMVFPALNNNFQNRKRTYRCCDNCRIKRRRCDIILDESGAQIQCVNCKRNGLKCTFDKPHRADLKQKKQQLLFHTYKQASFRHAHEVLLDFLRKTFSFQFGSSGRKTKPKAKPPRTVVLEWASDRPTTQDSETIHDDSEPEKPLTLKSEKTWRHLLLIHAFTLLSPEYEFRPEEVRKLLRIYFFKLNSILPFIDENAFWLAYDSAKDGQNNLLVYAMVLAILHDPVTEPVLRAVFRRRHADNSGSSGSSGNSDYLRDMRHLVLELELKVRHLLTVRADFGICSRLLKLQVLSLLLLHHRPDGLGRECSENDLAVAIHTCCLLGLHLRQSLYKLASVEEPEISETEAKNIFWTLFVLDRIKAATSTRLPFIRLDECNIEMPQNPVLLHLVNLLKTCELVLNALYKPFGDAAVDNYQKRLEQSNVEEFERAEFEVCRSDLSRQVFSLLLWENDEFLNNSETYVANQLYFTTRIWSNVLILVSQKMRFNLPSIPRLVPEMSTIRASANILWYFRQLEDFQITAGSLETWLLLMAMSIFTKARAVEILEGQPGSYRKETDYVLEDFFRELNKFRQKRWIVDRHLIVCEKFIEVLQEKKPRDQVVIDDLPGEWQSLLPLPDLQQSLRDGDYGAIHLDMYTSEMFKDIPNVFNMM